MNDRCPSHIHLLPAMHLPSGLNKQHLNFFFHDFRKWGYLFNTADLVNA